MNYIMISPSFPRNYKYFAIALKNQGINVLGIGSEDYDLIDQDLKDSLTMYYKVDDLENYDDVMKAVGFLTHKYGKIDRIESHNEHWLMLDAKLRTDFNVFGFHTEDMDFVKKKSCMKEIFTKAGVPVIRGGVPHTEEETRALIKELGFPVVAKPDSGVGAAHTYKIKHEDDVERYLRTKPPIDYIIEEFIVGDIETYDGLVDINGDIIFENSLVYIDPPMDIMNLDTDNTYYTAREIPEDTKRYGEKSIQAFNLRERFFHLEFFRRQSGELVALEINIRPPGGKSLDMFNHSADVDLFNDYAEIVAGHQKSMRTDKLYYSCYVGIKDRPTPRLHSHDEIIARLGPALMSHGTIEAIFARIMGNYYYLFRVKTIEELLEYREFICAMAK